MKTLLIIGYVWPEPNSSAAGSRMLQLIESFQADDYQVVYASPAAPSDHAIDYAAFNITTKSIELNNASFDRFIQSLNPDAVMFDRFMMEEQFAWRVEKHCPQALRILDTEDLHCLRHARQILAKGNSHVVQKVEKNILFGEHAKREIAAILRCDLTVMISEYEMALLIDTFNVPKHILMYLPFMIKPMTHNRQSSFDDRQHFVSIGNFRHEPNWDAVLQLKQHIWPQIRKALPKAQLHVYGAYPPKKATQLHNEKQGFHVKGWCENAFEVLENSRVLLAPLRFGAGLKGKMLDAAQCYLPAVTTSIGEEGLFKTGDNKTLISENDFTEFAQAAITLYQDQQTWQLLSDACPNFINQGFNEDHYRKQFIATLNNIAENLAEHRLNNFTGSMLRHHSMKATQYMAQWIEAKNK